MGIVKGNNKFGLILTEVRDEEYRRRAALKLASKSAFANAAEVQSEEGATAMVL